MKVGITGLVLPGAWSFDETLESLAESGYEAFELALKDSGYCSLKTSNSELEDLARRAGAAGIELTSICPSIRNRPKDLMHRDPAVRSEGVALFETIIDIASSIGVETILVVLGQLTANLFYDEAYDNARESMRTLSGAAERAGVNLAIEYIWNDFLLSPLELGRFCDEVGSERVGFYFDSANMVHTGYPEHWARICGGHMMAVHVKDFVRKTREWPALLEGDVDFQAVMRELKAIGFDGPLVSEVSLEAASLTETAQAIEKIIAM